MNPTSGIQSEGAIQSAGRLFKNHFSSVNPLILPVIELSTNIYEMTCTTNVPWQIRTSWKYRVLQTFHGISVHLESTVSTKFYLFWQMSHQCWTLGWCHLAPRPMNERMPNLPPTNVTKSGAEVLQLDWIKYELWKRRCFSGYLQLFMGRKCKVMLRKSIDEISGHALCVWPISLLRQ